MPRALHFDVLLAPRQLRLPCAILGMQPRPLLLLFSLTSLENNPGHWQTQAGLNNSA
jgi:hypothetical protein